MFKSNLFTIAGIVIAISLPVIASAAHPSSNATITVSVTHSQPVYETVRVNHPVETCRTKTVYEAPRYASRKPSKTINMLGAIAGGALGRHLGHGGQEEWLGTIVGGMLGHAVADEMQEHRRAHAPHVPARREVCEWVDQWETRRELIGYDVTYQLAGQTFTAFSTLDPGATMEISLIPSG